MKSVQRIAFESAIRLGVTPIEVLSNGRQPKIVFVRAVIVYALRHYMAPRPQPSYPEISKAMRGMEVGHSGSIDLERRGASLKDTPEFSAALRIVVGVIREQGGPHGLTTADFLQAIRKR